MESTSMQWFTGSSLSLRITILGLISWAIYAIVIHVQHIVADRKLLPLPPGPSGWPIIGNLLDVLRATKIREQHLLYEKWARQYGDLYKVRIGRFEQYMINSDVAVKQVFDKPAGISANRPPWLVSGHHMCNDWNLLLINADTPRWKFQRKFTWGNVGTIPKADAALPILNFETLKFLHEISQDEEIQADGHKIFQALMRYTYSNFTTQMFGMDAPNSTDPSIEHIHETGVAQIIGLLPGYFLVDVMPWLDKLPMFLKPWERAGRARFSRDMAWCMDKLQRVKAMPDRSAIRESLLCQLVEDEKFLGFESEEEGVYICLLLVIAGADTSQFSTWSFIEAMMEHPDVQQKARQEIAKVVGDRLPNFDDFEKIPYVRCVMKEVWRYRAPVGIGHPHRTTADIVYNGMRIPKGSRIQLNARAIHHDPVRHVDPGKFWPERYEDDTTSAIESINSANVKKRDHFAFGAGRRVCPGYHVAERSLAVAIMRILWAFEIKPSPSAKLPLNIADWRSEFPGLPGDNMPVTMVPVSDERKAQIDRYYQDALLQRAAIDPLDVHGGGK